MKIELISKMVDSKRVSYAGFIGAKVLRRGPKNATVEITVRFSPAGPWYTQTHRVPLRDILETVWVEEDQLTPNRAPRGSSGTPEYLRVVRTLLTAREARGPLPSSEEEEFKEKLDDLWWQMSDAQRAAMTAQLCPGALHQVDFLTANGSAPRDAAGRYDYDTMELLCRCGHRLGHHGAGSGKPGGRRVCQYGTGGCNEPPGTEPCSCENFTRTRPRSTHTPNASYYVWVLSRQDTPLDEGPYGPYALSQCEKYARIAATKGAHDRVVTRGQDPAASTFQFVRRYRHGTGERVL